MSKKYRKIKIVDEDKKVPPELFWKGILIILGLTVIGSMAICW